MDSLCPDSAKLDCLLEALYRWELIPAPAMLVLSRELGMWASFPESAALVLLPEAFDSELSQVSQFPESEMPFRALVPLFLELLCC